MTDPVLMQLRALCGRGDGALDQVALSLAEGQAKGHPAPDVDQFALVLRAAGSPHVWPRTWSLAGKLEPLAARDRMLKWLSTFDDGGTRYCGIGRATLAANTSEVLVVIAVDALATLNAPVPIRARSGTWLTLDAQEFDDSAPAKIVVLAPTGAPYTIPTSVDGGRILGRLRVDRPGHWKIQVLSVGESGPRPALEALVWVDSEPPKLAIPEPAPGEERANPAHAAEEQLYDMLGALRGELGLKPLLRDARLDALAREHSEAMMGAGRVGHDIGQGDPRSRLARISLSARRAGENVAHAASALLAHRTLWASPSHRGNLVDPNFNAVGLGVARDPDGSLWVTQEFAEL